MQSSFYDSTNLLFEKGYFQVDDFEMLVILCPRTFARFLHVESTPQTPTKCREVYRLFAVYALIRAFLPVVVAVLDLKFNTSEGSFH